MYPIPGQQTLATQRWKKQPEQIHLGKIDEKHMNLCYYQFRFQVSYMKLVMLETVIHDESIQGSLKVWRLDTFEAFRLHFQSHAEPAVGGQWTLLSFWIWFSASSRASTTRMATSCRIWWRSADGPQRVPARRLLFSKFRLIPMLHRDAFILGARNLH